MFKILLVDDHEAILEAYRELLEDKDFTVLTADSPEKGMEITQQENQPMVIISDIKFPLSRIDGLEFIRWLKKNHPGHEVIVISGHATMDLVIEAIRLDASDFIPKPCETNLLLLAIKRASQKLEMRQTIQKYTKSLEHIVKERANEIKRMEAQLVEAAKLSAMGELAASVCHELRQPLCGIMGFSYLIEREIAKDSPAWLYLKKLDEQCERMKEIIENLRAFSHRADNGFELMHIRESLEDALFLFTQQLKNHNIKIRKNIPADLPPILGNKNKWQQVFINLISNARDALIAQTKQKEKWIIIRAVWDTRAQNIQIRLSDNGIGIDHSIQPRIFDSFFSTKSVEQGTGLGLSIVRNIIADHNGQINLLSKPGSGTSFIIRLPVAENYKTNNNTINLEKREAA